MISKQTKPQDYCLLAILGAIWGSAFFNIKIARLSFDPFTIAFFRVFLGSLPVIIFCFYRGEKIEAFTKEWPSFLLIGLINLVIPFFLISYSINALQSNLAALLMGSNPLTASLIGHFFLREEKINLLKFLGVCLGFSGLIFLFFDKSLLNQTNMIKAFLILLASSFYVIGGTLTIKMSLKGKSNENVTASTLLWATICLLPFTISESPWNLKPSFESITSLIYLGLVPTGLAWSLRFHILKRNGLLFQAQVAYLIPLFGVLLGALFMNESITPKIIVSLAAVIGGIYLVKKGKGRERSIDDEKISKP